MTNKTDKAIIEEFERLPTDSAPWQDAAFEIVLKDFLLKDEALAFLKQALSRKEEEMIALFAQALVVNIPEDMAGQVMAYKHCLSQIKDNLSNKGIEL